MNVLWIAAVLAAATVWTDAAHAACPSPVADQTIALPGHPFAAEPSADDCHLFVSLVGGRTKGAVAVLANEDGKFRLVRTVEAGQGSGGGLVLSHDGAMLAVGAEEAVTLYDVAKLETADQDPVVAVLGEGTRGAIYTQFSKDDAVLFVSEERNASLAVIDVAAARAGKGARAVIGRVPVGEAPVGLALSPDGARLFSTSQSAGVGNDCKPEQEGGRMHAAGALYVIDVAKAAADPRHAVRGAIRAGCNPVRVVVSADGRALWISARGDGRILGLDPSALDGGAAGGRTVSLAVGRSPVGLAIRPDGAQLWVADSDRFGSGAAGLAMVTPADPAKARLSGTMKVGGFPRDLRFLADGRTLVVALFAEQAVLLHRTDAGSVASPTPVGR